jgi:apolipoprotein N-acyltransferase
MRTFQTIRLSQWILALSSGCLLVAGFPKIDQGWLAWVALVPLLIAIRQATMRAGFMLGLITGLVQYVGLMYWTTYTMHTYGKLPLSVSMAILLLFAAVLAVYTALFAMFVCRLCRKPWQLIVLSPALWVILEWLRSWLFTGFPWELLGYSQYKHLWVIQIADLFGVLGISALIVFFNAVLTLAFLKWVDKPWQIRPVARTTLMRAGIALAGVLLITVGYGIYRLHTTAAMLAKADQVKVAVVQGNIDEAVKWDASFQVLTTVKYRTLSLEAAKKGAGLIIWPETAAPFYMFHDKLLTDMVLQGVKAADAYFIIGSPAAQVDNGKIHYFNRAYLIAPDGKVAGQYDKVHLVPYGEYVPLKRWFPFLGKLVAQVGDFEAGRRGNTLVWKGKPLGVLICYEVIFPDLARAMVQNGAQLLVNITNDAWFGRTSAAYQHFSMAVLRSVENRRFLVRAANTGISGVIDPTGRILAASALYMDATLTSPIELLNGRTLYSRWGDWPLVMVCLALSAATFIAQRIWDVFVDSGNSA